MSSSSSAEMAGTSSSSLSSTCRSLLRRYCCARGGCRVFSSINSTSSMQPLGAGPGAAGGGAEEAATASRPERERNRSRSGEAEERLWGAARHGSRKHEVDGEDEVGSGLREQRHTSCSDSGPMEWTSALRRTEGLFALSAIADYRSSTKCENSGQSQRGPTEWPEQQAASRIMPSGSVRVLC